jgi:hypothetical protein
MAVQEPRTCADVNAVVGGYLRDLAFAQSSQQKMFGARFNHAQTLRVHPEGVDRGPETRR